MLFHCQFTWFPGTNRAVAAQWMIQQHDAGKNNPEQIRGRYILLRERFDHRATVPV